MKNYSVTAIMPTCGRTTCIGESIYSFINQTYENKKLIILDTHPQDITFDIPLPKNITYLKEDSHKYSNLGDKYKQLIKAIDTDLFCIWEDDDIWLPNHIESLVELYNPNDKSKRPLKLGHESHFSVLGGVDRPIHHLSIGGNVCWCRYIFENKNINVDNLIEPFDINFLGLFDHVWENKNNMPTYLYRWDNGQCHMSGLYGSKSYDELYRSFEDALSKEDISDVVTIGWRHNYLELCNTVFNKKNEN